MSIRSLAAAANVGILLLTQCLAAQASEIRLIVATPMTGVVKELGSRFERDTGHKLATKFVSGPVVKQEIEAGQPFDVAISITPVIDELIKEGKLVAATRADVAYAGVGVGVRAGAPKPDINSADAFRRALLNAKSVAHSATGASGTYFKGLLDRLGIAEQKKPKLRPMPADKIAQAVPSGEAEMIVVTMSVIVGSGADLVGPVPPELQFYNSFAAGVGANTKEAEASKALVKFLTGPAAIQVIKSNGMEPGRP